MRERELYAEMQRIHDKDVILLHELQAELKTHQSDLKDIKEKLKLHEQNSSELFIASKRASGQLAQLQSSLQKVTDNIGYQRYSIVRDPLMEKILQNKAWFADVEQIYGVYFTYKISLRRFINANNNCCYRICLTKKV